MPPYTVTSSVLILVVACASVQSRSPISGLLKELIEEVKAEVKAEEAIAHPLGAKTEVVYKNENKQVGHHNHCDDEHHCKDAGCCP